MASGHFDPLIQDLADSSLRPPSAGAALGCVGSCGLSVWSRSAAKRLFDCACVLLAMPVALPVFLAIAAAVRLSSPGPVFFLQKRVGRYGRPFTIFKFRTMADAAGEAEPLVASWGNDRLTPIGAFLRRSKLDELPQIANVLLGQMSLVGPRPKPPEEMTCDLDCRPGITGMATVAFAHEETLFARVPRDRFRAYFHGVVLPVKRQLDAAYMARATFLSDLDLLFRSVFRRWDTALAERVIAAAAFVPEGQQNSAFDSRPEMAIAQSLGSLSSNQAEAAEQLPVL
jgi:lipopolysaccharide/colanic/teichoic acid biosynthesis glycosyltransferase